MCVADELSGGVEETLCVPDEESVGACVRVDLLLLDTDDEAEALEEGVEVVVIVFVGL